jgi:hypothetical protein
MRTSRKRQAGLGMLGWLVVLGLAAFGLTCFFKIGPVYLDYWQTKKAIEDVVLSNQAMGQSNEELFNSIEKHLDVSRVESITVKDMRVINEPKGGRVLDAHYEKRVPLIGNIDVVVKFDELKYPLGAVTQ